MKGRKQIAVQTQLWGNANLEQDFVPIYNDVIESGYDGVESRFTVMKQKEKLRRYLEEKPLRIFALHASPGAFYNQGIKPEFGELLQEMQAFDVHHLLFSPPKCENMQEQRKWLDIISQMGELSADIGVLLSYHNHAWEFEKYGYDLLDAVAEYDQIGIALDIGWLYRGGYGLQETVQRYKSKIQYLHIKDTTMDQWKELGTGDTHLAESINMLESLRLDLWTIEQDNSQLPPLESAKQSRRFLTQFGI